MTKAMFIEWWERIRGLDQWLETRAVIRSARSWGLPWENSGMPEGSTVPAWRWNTLVKALNVQYKSADGATHFRKVWLLPGPILFALSAGDDFCVQYDPKNPRRLYIRERTQTILRAAFGLLIGALVAVWIIQRSR